MPSSGLEADRGTLGGGGLEGFGDYVKEKEDIFESDSLGGRREKQDIDCNYSNIRPGAVPCGPGDLTCWWGMLCCLLTFSLIIVLAVVLTIVLPIVHRNSSSSTTIDVATNSHSFGDSRLQSFSSFFCESISIEVDSTTNSATLALIDSPPLLADKNSFNITDQRTLQSRQFQFWKYYLHPNSNISISILCNTFHNRNVNIYIVKGNSNANNWARSPSSIHAESFRSVRQRCTQETLLTYNVHEEDDYYVFIYNPLGSSSTSYSAALNFERFEYVLQAKHSCSTSSRRKCSVDIPYGTGSQRALVTTSIPDNVNWSENVSLKTSCSRRHWAYALVILLPLIVIIGSVATCTCLFCYNNKSGKKDNFV